MLEKILSVSGRPGLYQLVSQGKNCIIVESLTKPAKRLPVFNTEKIMSLGDIAIYTTGEEKPLAQVMEAIKEKNNGAEVDIKAMEKNGSIRDEFKAVLPEFDEERVRTSDIKKVYAWYNILIDNGVDKFVEPEAETEEAEEKSEDKEA